MYLLAGCPNYKPTDTLAFMKEGICPRRDVKKGNFKFTVLGLMSGSDINTLNTEHPPRDKAHLNPTPVIYRTKMSPIIRRWFTELCWMWVPWRVMTELYLRCGFLIPKQAQTSLSRTYGHACGI
jgi:hypothetical protein